MHLETLLRCISRPLVGERKRKSIKKQSGFVKSFCDLKKVGHHKHRGSRYLSAAEFGLRTAFTGLARWGGTIRHEKSMLKVLIWYDTTKSHLLEGKMAISVEKWNRLHGESMAFYCTKQSRKYNSTINKNPMHLYLYRS